MNAPMTTGKVTAPKLTAMKAAGRKIVMLTAYDAPTASLLDASGVDCLLVGDSVGTTVQGRDTTLPVTLDQIIYHAEIVGRAVQRALVIVDLPFGSFQIGPKETVAAAVRVLKETGCPAVKLESSLAQADCVAALADAGIPVMAHCGLRPQSVHQIGGYKVQRDRERVLADAKAAADAGAFAVVLECVPVSLADEITAAISIPTIGIGAGAGCDGQVLVVHDLLGMTPRPARFVKAYAQLAETIQSAARQYCDEVRGGTFPSEEHTYQ
ncbi:MAG TPA: 3-methyl-2-oxobutanoate hydroxymethyltransferase [Pirellulales bacterium]